ncbi:hypothetical protein CR513_27653, partial [Mucuna pruriens]
MTVYQQAEAEDVDNQDTKRTYARKSKEVFGRNLNYENTFLWTASLTPHVRMMIFSMSLKGATLNWYTRLPPNLIDSFATLMEKFEAQYTTCKPHYLTLVEEDESLRSFMEHFSAVAMKIKDLNLEVTLHSMIMTLKPELFSNNLYKRPLTLIGELRAKGLGYIQMEEMKEFQNGVRAEHQKAKNRQKDGEAPHALGQRKRHTGPSIKVALLEKAFNVDLIMLPRKGGHHMGLTKPSTVDTTKTTDTPPNHARC